MKRICVFCGSNRGAKAEYRAAAAETGRLLVRRGIGLVYGGGAVGLMGVIANAVLDAGGEAIGIIPRTLVEREVGHPRLSETHVVETMHQRKALMSEMADGFIALPGGVGTMEELFEVWTWAQLGLHRKPCGLLNVGGFYRTLVTFLDYSVTEEFLRPQHRSMLMVESDPAALLDRFAIYEPPTVAKWLDPSTA